MIARTLGGLIASVTPRSDNFFKLFNELAACTVRGAKYLAQMTAMQDPEAFQELFVQIQRTESEADAVTRNIFLTLHSSFITPFDRWEIKELAKALDDMIDYIEDIPQHSKLYGLGHFTPEMAALGQITVRAAEKVEEAVVLLSDMKNAERILKICQEIGDIESEADRIMHAGMVRLFAENADARTLIRDKKLYELFEEAVDRAEDVADVMHGVVLERLWIDPVFLTMAILVALALVFDFMNGFHDSANSIALMVSTRLLTPQAAVIWAAFFNFVAFLFFGLAVAKTVGSGIVSTDIVDNAVVFGALCGATIWNVITWWFGIPSSSSHGLVGGLVGAALAKAGPGSIIALGLIKTSAAIVLSPMLGMLLAMLFCIVVLWLFRDKSPSSTEGGFNKAQFISSSLYSLGHGGNDAQKTMGIITVLLYANGYLQGEFHVPFWVVLACQIAMALGTLFGGWRIVRTMGMGITRVRPTGAFSAQTAGAVTLFLATYLGIPVSTTHTITGAIVGIGVTRRLSAVRWSIASRIVWAWVLTIPLSGLIAAFFWYVAQGFMGQVAALP